MVARATPLVILAALAGGCAAPPDAGGASCVALFERYDRIEATMSTPSGRADRRAIPPALERPVGDLRQAGCLTLSRDLDLAVAGPPVTDGGAAITPVGVHAGVVTNVADEAAALQFFAARGVAARSIGAPGLGRRIYLGPFATEGALQSATALARAAGFAAPYPANL
jgi:hypothetical protein